MLSKSAARQFFLVGTILSSAAFVLLTVDTIQRVPAQIHQDKLTPETIRGKHAFDHRNCMGCHTILGEGAYYAPELTKVYERRGPDFIRAILRDPQAMYPGQRKMMNYHLPEGEIEDLVAFLKWIGEIDLNGFPPKPDLAKGAVAAASASSLSDIRVAQSRPKIFGQICVACHSIGGAGGAVGPALDDVGSRRDRKYLVAWLHNPSALKPDSKMPKLPLADGDIEELATFLSQMKGGKAQ